MKNRQHNKKITPKKKKTSKENEIYSMPKVIAKPKLTEEEKEEKQRVLKVNRENNENDLFSNWIHRIKNLSKHELGVINRPEDYPMSKKNYSYNGGVQRQKDELKLWEFFLVN